MHSVATQLNMHKHANISRQTLCSYVTNLNLVDVYIINPQKTIRYLVHLQRSIFTEVNPAVHGATDVVWE